MKKEQFYFVDEYQMAVALLKEIVPLAAYSGEEERRAAFLFDFLSARASSGSFSVERTGNNLFLSPCFVDPHKPNLMMCAHLDTVQPASGYTFDPFQVSEKENAIYGLGTNDDGASLVSQVAVFLHFHAVPDRFLQLEVNLFLAITAEEENSGSGGMSRLLVHLRKDGAKYPDFAIVGEPTSMKVAIAERGLLVLDGLALGESGHAAREEGVNALYIALEDVMAIRDFSFDRVSPLMGRVKATVTAFHSGQQHNVIPDRAAFTVDIRPNECYRNEEILEELQRVVKSRLKARNMEHRTSSTPADHLLLRAVKAAGLETYVSPTTSDWMLLDVPALKLGPGESSRSHKKDEFIRKSEICEGIGGYIDFIRNIGK